MKKIILFSFLISVFLTTYSQSYVLSDLNGQSIDACSGTFTLGSYTAGDSFALTVCSNDAINNHVTLAITSYSFPSGTSLCVYDGESTSDDLLVCWDETTTSGSIAARA